MLHDRPDEEKITFSICIIILDARNKNVTKASKYRSSKFGMKNTTKII